MALGNLLNELKRRNVIRVAVAYLVASWVLLQVADLVLDNIGAPGWVMQAFMLALGLGFPLVLIFSWAFELTPDGLKRESEIDPTESLTRHTARKLDRITIGLLVLVLVVVGVERLVPRGENEAAAGAPAAEVAAEDKSIAVLAFQDLSPGGDQAYFAEGISEELLNVLAQMPGLKVAGRTSSFAFKDQNRDLREIGEILEVANILEGSVRTSGNRVRVTAQLVKAKDGFHLFSRNYEGSLDDIFAVQDQIAREISLALKSAILGKETLEAATPTNVEAFDRYLKARQWISTRDRPLMEQASDLLDEALAIDPDYAPALAQKALSLLLLSNAPGSYGDIPADAALRMSRPLLDRALAVDPDNADAHAVLGLWLSNTSAMPNPEAVVSLQRALAINPNMANGINWLATELSRTDRFEETLRLYESVIEHDPLYRPAFNNLTFQYLQTRSQDKADSLIRRVQRISGESPHVIFARGALAVTNGKLADAMNDLQKAYDYNPSASVVQLWYSTTALFLGEYDTATSAALPTDKLVPLFLAGRDREAKAVFDGLQISVFDEGTLRGIGDWMLMEDRPADLLAYLEHVSGKGDDWLDAQPRPDQLWGAAHWTNIAYALQATGQEDAAQRVLDDIRKMLEDQAAYGANNLFYWLNAAEYDALTGNVESMLANLKKSMDTGNTCAAGFYSAPFNRYRGDTRFREAENESIRRAKEERRKLGMLET